MCTAGRKPITAYVSDESDESGETHARRTPGSERLTLQGLVVDVVLELLLGRLELGADGRRLLLVAGGGQLGRKLGLERALRKEHTNTCEPRKW